MIYQPRNDIVPNLHDLMLKQNDLVTRSFVQNNIQTILMFLNEEDEVASNNIAVIKYKI